MIKEKQVAPAVPPGSICANSDDGQHLITVPKEDQELQKVLTELASPTLEQRFTRSIQSAIDYVLDGPKTGRFHLNDPEVDRGERASVGVKLEYELLNEFSWVKTKPLDTIIAGIPVDIKATVSDNWSIPKEAHCQLCICVKIDTMRYRHQARLFRTHRSWLYSGKGNGDGKRGIVVDAIRNYGVPLYGEGTLPRNPLTLLGDADRLAVFDQKVGQERRLIKLFTALPEIVIPRSVILTVCARNHDPLRRARAIKSALADLGYTLLCGKWSADQEAAAKVGFDLSGAAWVSLRKQADGNSH